MRMLRSSPAIGAGTRPNCEAFGFLLDAAGKCAYLEAYHQELAANPGAQRARVSSKTCLCTHMRNYQCWTCGHLTYRLKDTSRRKADGSYQILSAEHVFRDYQFGVEDQIALPEPEDSATQAVGARRPLGNSEHLEL
jgi:nitronate monooxygenase